MTDAVPFTARIELHSRDMVAIERLVSAALRRFGPAVGVTLLGWVEIQLTVLAPDFCAACSSAVELVRGVVPDQLLSVEARVLDDSNAR